MVFVGKYEWLLKQDTAEPDIFDLDTVEPVGAIPIAFLISPVYRLPTYMEWLMEQSMHEMYGQLTDDGLNTMEANE